MMRPFGHDRMHIENLGGDISPPAPQNRRLIIGCFPWKFQGGEAAFARMVAFDGEWPGEPVARTDAGDAARPRHRSGSRRS